MEDPRTSHLTASGVVATLIESATRDALDPSDLNGSPNRLLFIPSPVTFSDGDFFDMDWTQSGTRGWGGSASAGQKTTNGAFPGNPDAFRQVDYTVNAPGSPGAWVQMLTTSWWGGGSYDPRVMGAIESISGALDLRDTAPECNSGTGIPAWDIPQLSLRQDGVEYEATFGLCHGLSATAWQRMSTASLGSHVFNPLAGSSLRQPDFSFAGLPIHFGFGLTFVNLSPGPRAGSRGVDNWTVVVWRSAKP
jgi:hypothetical protein